MDQTAHSEHSSLRERIVEHVFVGDVLRNLWAHGVYDVEVLRSEFDAHGYDVVLSRGKLVRHVQLKASIADKPTDVSVARALADKPSGCVVWIKVSLDLKTMGPYFWYGGRPGEPLPAIDHLDPPLRATHNKDGERPERKNHRSVRGSVFKPLATLEDVIGELFGRL